jgi:thiamine-monophosphate kinase
MALASEQDFLDLVDRHFPNTHAGVELGRGDDCAVIRPGGDLCVSTDLFLEDQHFRRSYFSAGDIGYKGLAVNVSDILGMGGRPTGFCLSLMAPRGIEDAFWEEFFAAMADLAREVDAPLVGGDLSSAEKIGVCVTIWGEAIAQGRFLRRGMTRPGDTVFMAGRPGLARAGLLCLEDEGLRATDVCPEAVQAHLRPRMLMRQAVELAGDPGVRGLMDVSDGLARDLPRFLAEGQGLEVKLDPGALHPEVVAQAEARGEDPVEFALLGGEDYGLLAAADEETCRALSNRIADHIITGTVVDRPGLWRNGSPLTLDGFDHFAS